MADWFETRFREPVDAGQLDPAFVARVRALVVKEWQADAGWTPSEDSDADDPEGDIIMLDTEDRPTGNEPASPRNGSPGRWLLVAAAVALVAIIGAVLAAGDDEDKIDTVTSVPAPDPGRPVADLFDQDLEPGRYVIDPDADAATPLRVTYDVAAEGWRGWLGTYKEVTGAGRVILAITTVDNVVREACSDQRPAEPAVGPTVDDLATALANLAPFEVTSPPSDVTIAGYHGKHLELRVPDLRVTNGSFADCTGGNLHSWIAPYLGGSFFGYDNSGAGGTEEFWILDVEGTRLVLVTDQSPTSRPQDLAEMEAIFDSIRIEP
ncbi:MAG: hypothetical protein ACRDZU_00940 [Acidimicrobiales bacterium]